MRSEVIKASAGSGKTYELARAYLLLLLEGYPPPSILATTFTKKAAAEIRARIVSWLVDGVNNPDILSQRLERSYSKEDYYKALGALIESQDKDLILTLDKLFANVARCYPFEVDLPAFWSHVATEKLEEKKSQALQKILSEEDLGVLYPLLEAFVDNKSPLNFLHKINTRFDKFSKVARTYVPCSLVERPGSEDFSEQVREVELAKNQSGAPDKNWQKRVAKDAEFLASRNYSEFLKSGLLKASLTDSNFSRKEISEATKDIYIRAGRLAGLHLLDQSLRTTAKLFNLFMKYHSELVSSLSKEGLVTFDQVTEAIGALTGNLDVFCELDVRIQHILLDEFQDTSREQWRILKPLCEEIVASGRRFLCVGDEKQAIYGWRGGEAKIFREVTEELPGVEVTAKVQSYRSAPEIIEAVNETFTGQHPNFLPHKTALKDESGYVRYTKSEEVEKDVLLALEEVTELHPDAEVAMLFRTNQDLIDYQELLEEEGYEVSAEGKRLLLKDPGVSAIISAIQHFYFPGHTLAKFIFENSVLSDIENNLIEVGIHEFVTAAAGRLPQSRELDDYLLFTAEFEGTIAEFIDASLSVGKEVTGDGSIKLLTIHKSKGLEFDVVFLPKPDFKPSYADFIEISKDNRVLTKGLLARPNKELRAVFPEIESFCQEDDEEKLLESKNLLYVAMTRAKKAMFLFGKDESYEKGSLKNLQIDNRIASSNYIAKPAKLDFAPSSLRAFSRVSEKFQGGDVEAGTLLHRVLEKVSFIEDDYPEHKLLEPYRGKFEELFSRSRYVGEVVLYREYPILTSTHFCRVDRLVVGEGFAEVIDFKLSRPDESYFEQLQTYMEAVECLFGLKKSQVKGTLAFFHESTVTFRGLNS